MKLRAALVAVAVSLTALSGCAIPAEESSTREAQGLTLVSADATNGIVARWIAGTTTLEFRSKIVDGVAVSEVVDGAGKRLTTVSFPVGVQPASRRALVEQGSADSLPGLQDLAKDKAQVATMMMAFGAASKAIGAALPKDLPPEMVSALQAQASVLAFGLLHLNPRALAALEAPRPDGKTGYMASTDGISPDPDPSTTTTTSTPAPNDDSDDYGAEPTTWIEYDADGNVVGGNTPYYMQVYFSSNRCDGACGPGCGWCASLGGGGYLCETNWFCQWHDTHCGAYWHFFDCH